MGAQGLSLEVQVLPGQKVPELDPPNKGHSSGRLLIAHVIPLRNSGSKRDVDFI
jgi:hypothetical protein